MDKGQFLASWWMEPAEILTWFKSSQISTLRPAGAKVIFEIWNQRIKMHLVSETKRNAKSILIPLARIGNHEGNSTISRTSQLLWLGLPSFRSPKQKETIGTTWLGKNTWVLLEQSALLINSTVLATCESCECADLCWLRLKKGQHLVTQIEGLTKCNLSGGIYVINLWNQKENKTTSAWSWSHLNGIYYGKEESDAFHADKRNDSSLEFVMWSSVFWKLSGSFQLPLTSWAWPISGGPTTRKVARTQAVFCSNDRLSFK